MLAEERFSLIMEQLNRKRTVTVQELCEALNTSESTIRRDLTELDRLGKLNKVHGGATLPDSRFLADEPTMEAKESQAVEQKRSIAQRWPRRAAGCICPEDCCGPRPKPLWVHPQSPACSATILPRRSWVPTVWRWMPVLPRRTPRKLP